MGAFVREYSVKPDSGNRVTLRLPLYSSFRVREYEDGRVLLEPQKEEEQFLIAPEDFQTLDEAMKELENGCELRTLNLSQWDVEEP